MIILRACIWLYVRNYDREVRKFLTEKKHAWVLFMLSLSLRRTSP